MSGDRKKTRNLGNHPFCLFVCFVFIQFAQITDSFRNCFQPETLALKSKKSRQRENCVRNGFKLRPGPAINIHLFPTPLPVSSRKPSAKNKGKVELNLSLHETDTKTKQNQAVKSSSGPARIMLLSRYISILCTKQFHIIMLTTLRRENPPH